MIFFFCEKGILCIELITMNFLWFLCMTLFNAVVLYSAMVELASFWLSSIWTLSYLGTPLCYAGLCGRDGEIPNRNKRKEQISSLSVLCCSSNLDLANQMILSNIVRSSVEISSTVSIQGTQHQHWHPSQTFWCRLDWVLSCQASSVFCQYAENILQASQSFLWAPTT